MYAQIEAIDAADKRIIRVHVFNRTTCRDYFADVRRDRTLTRVVVV